MSADRVLRICDMCGEDRPSIHVINNACGHGIGLFGSCCSNKVQVLLNTLNAKHGAYIVDGRYLSSPWHSPDVRSLKELREAIDDGS